MYKCYECDDEAAYLIAGTVYCLKCGQRKREHIKERIEQIVQLREKERERMRNGKG